MEVSRFKGCLLGAAIGDALGRPFEGEEGPIDIIRIKQVIEGLEKLIYTDDTHMTIGVAESLIQKKGFDADHMAMTFLRNYKREPWRGYGYGPPRIFMLMEKGHSWEEASRSIYPGGSYGNGAAMRVAPIGLLYSKDLERLRDVAMESSRITHSHRMGMEGATLQALAVAIALRTRKLEKRTFVERLSSFTYIHTYREKLLSGYRLLGQENELIASSLGNGIEAIDSVPTAIHAFLRYPESFRDAVTWAISLGGDTDTIASMTGAISGAYLGRKAIPEEWLERLENREYIEELGRRLHELYLFLYPRDC